MAKRVEGLPPVGEGEKACRRCKTAKLLEEFTKDSRNKDGRVAYCRPCDVAYKKERGYRSQRKYQQSEAGRKNAVAAVARYQKTEKGRAMVRAYDQKRAQDPDRKAWMQAFHSRPDVKARRSQQRKDWYADGGAEQVKARQAEPARVERRKERTRDRYQSEPSYTMECRLRTRLLGALRRYGDGRKTHRFETYLGCTLAELVAYLESKFQPGMSWENRSAWRIDHIRPCATFDLTDPVQQRACFHYSNLQPLWAGDNLRKSARWADPSVPPMPPGA